MSSWRAWIHDLLPPMIARPIRHVFRPSDSQPEPIQFRGDYAAWNAAIAECEGYASDVIFHRVAESTRAVLDRKAAYEQDGVLFDKLEFRYPLMTALLHAAVKSGHLRVLDFGGSLGGLYLQHRSLLSAVKEVRWAVVEQPRFVELAGQLDMPTEIRLFREIDEAVAWARPNVLLLSSVLPYLADPWGLFAKLLERNIPFLILDRTPFLPGNRDVLTVQSVPAWVYGRPVRYPAWFLSEDRFQELIDSRYDSVCFWDAIGGPYSVGSLVAKSLGQLLRLQQSNHA